MQDRRSEAARSPRRALRELWRRRAVATPALALAVLAALLGVRALGALEGAELALYDRFLAWKPRASRPDPRLAIIAITEDDLQRLARDPVPDAEIARALRILTDAGARAVGVDIWRDFPVPPGTEDLHAILRESPRIVGIRFYAREDTVRGMACPPPLIDTERCAFNDVVFDPDGFVRRALLYLRQEGEPTGVSLPLTLALLAGVQEAWEEQPDGSNAVRLGTALLLDLRADHGGYVGAEDRGYQLLVDFAGTPDHFDTFTLTDLLEGQVGAAVLRDRVVLIGYTAISKKDFFQVPIRAQYQAAGEGLSGVALHAHILSQLLRLADGGARPIRALGEVPELAWVVAWTGLGMLLGLRVRRAWLFALLTGVGLCACAGAGLALLAAGWWVPTAAPGLGFALCAALLTAQALSREQTEFAALEQLLGKELTKMVRTAPDRFLENGRPVPQRMVATFLFADLKGYTSASEQMEPREVMEWINDFMEEMTRVILEHGGVVDDFAGDGLKADFGLPFVPESEVDHAADARHAVDCALDMELAFTQLNKRWEQQSMRTAAGMRIGLFTGAAVAGCVGATGRIKYTVIGDAVNTASRLESFDQVPHDFEKHPCRILIGDTTEAYVRNHFRCEPLGEFLVKGKREKIGIHAVLGRRRAPAALAGEDPT